MSEAADLIFEELHSPGVRDFLGWSARPGAVSDEALGRALLELVKRVDRAGKDETLVDAVGRTKKDEV